MTLQQSLFGNLTHTTATNTTLSQTNLETPIEQAIFTVIDLETTGLNPKRNAITEATAIQFQNGVEVNKFTTLMKPTEPISAEVEAITGISNEMVANAPLPVIVLAELAGFMGEGALIVGHNVQFDIAFLREKAMQNGLAALAGRFTLEKAFCTKTLANKALPGLPSYEGIVVATQLGVHNPNPHRAEADVRMAAGILFELIARLKSQGVLLETVSDLLHYQGSLMAGQTGTVSSSLPGNLSAGVTSEPPVKAEGVLAS